MSRFRVLLLALIVAAIARQGAAAERLVYQEDSLYFRIFVLRKGDTVTLRFGRRNSPYTVSRINLARPEQHAVPYTAVMYCGLFYRPTPRRVLRRRRNRRTLSRPSPA